MQHARTINATQQTSASKYHTMNLSNYLITNWLTHGQKIKVAFLVNMAILLWIIFKKGQC